MRPLFIRADASTQIGIGHVMRCLALAQEWQHQGRAESGNLRPEGRGGKTEDGGRGRSVVFVCAELPKALERRLHAENCAVVRIACEPGSPEDARSTLEVIRKCLNLQPSAFSLQPSSTWLVADCYHFGADYQHRIKETGLRLLLVDDYGHAEHYFADLVLNQNLSADTKLYAHREPYTRLLLGTRYALLREEFLKYRDWRRRIPAVARKVLVTLGGTDPDNVTGIIVELLRGLDVEAKIGVGGSNPHIEGLRAETGNLKHGELIVDAENMPELMAWADVAIAAGGTTSWELAFMGLPSLVIMIAENQKDIATALDREEVSVSLGEHTSVTVKDMADALQSLLVDPARREAMSKRGRELVDGAGVTRVLNELRGTRLHITIASDEGSWLNDYLPAFIAELGRVGHRINWVHSAQEIEPGDLCLLLSFGQIVAGVILKYHWHNLVVHESALPSGRGWSPLTWQILEGSNDIPVTLFEAADSVDSGPIYGRTTIHFKGTELVEELRAAQARATFELCHAFISRYPESAERSWPQVGEPSYYPRRRPADSQMDPYKTLAEQFNLLRVVDNERYPAFFEHKGRRYVLKVEKQA